MDESLKLFSEDKANIDLEDFTVDPPAKSLTCWGFSEKPLDFPKS